MKSGDGVWEQYVLTQQIWEVRKSKDLDILVSCSVVRQVKERKVFTVFQI